MDMDDKNVVKAMLKDYGEAVNALGAGGGTRDIDIRLGNVVTATVSTSTNTFTFSNPSASGTACSFTLLLTNGGSQTVNWPAAVNWADGTAPTLTVAGTDILNFITTNGGSDWYGFSAGNIPPPIVTSGLIFNLDAGNTASYPGTGTAWSDLTGTYADSTLTDGPTFDSGNRGSIVFDGTNDYATCAATSTSVTSNFTMEAWCKPTATQDSDSEATTGFGGISGQRYVIGPNFVATPNAGSGISVGTNSINVYEHSNGYIPALLVYTASISASDFSHVLVIYEANQPRLYLNGTLVRTGLTSTKTVNLSSNSIGSELTYGYFQGNIAVVRFYNRVLEDEEVTQNYLALKDRFGLA